MNLKWNLEDLRKIDILFAPVPTQQVREYLDEHFLNPASLPAIARMFGLNKILNSKRVSANSTTPPYSATPTNGAWGWRKSCSTKGS
jgi:hypothetical protein